MQPAPVHYGFILGLDGGGKVQYNLQDPSGKFGQMTSVQEYQGKLYIGTLGEEAIAVIDMP